MSDYGKLLRKTEDGYLHRCPACDETHYITVTASRGPNWSFNGDAQKPSFSPSVKITGKRKITEEEYTRIMAGEKIDLPDFCCHYFITSGKIAYCGDCSHGMAGKEVDLPEFSTEITPS